MFVWRDKKVGDEEAQNKLVAKLRPATDAVTNGYRLLVVCSMVSIQDLVTMDRAKPGSFKKRLTRVLSLGGIEPPTLPPSPVRKINGKLRPMSDGGVQGATFYLPSPVTSPTSPSVSSSKPTTNLFTARGNFATLSTVSFSMRIHLEATEQLRAQGGPNIELKALRLIALRINYYLIETHQICKLVLPVRRRPTLCSPTGVSRPYIHSRWINPALICCTHLLGWSDEGYTSVFAIPRGDSSGRYKPRKVNTPGRWILVPMTCGRTKANLQLVCRDATEYGVFQVGCEECLSNLFSLWLEL
ncbi:hypothetical protein J6590_018726 [Homalodisca vitripennis]|nr:hypothetical protein J6590_018726 [Homalodisca vitripennis]